MPAARAATVQRAAAAVAAGDLAVDPGVERDDLRDRLRRPPRHRPVDRRRTSPCARSATRTSSFLPTSACVGRSRRSEVPATRAVPSERAEAWRPWRSYALTHLWTTLAG